MLNVDLMGGPQARALFKPAAGSSGAALAGVAALFSAA